MKRFEKLVREDWFQVSRVENKRYKKGRGRRRRRRDSMMEGGGEKEQGILDFGC